MSVKSGGKGHNLRDSHFGCGADTGHSLCELHDKRLGSGTVLRKVIDRGADFEHGVFNTIHLLHAEDITQLGDGLRCTFSEVDQSHVDDRSGLDILLDGSHGVVTEAPALLGEKIKLLAGETGIHTLEDLVEFFNLCGGHTGILDGVCHLFFHICV